MYFLAKSRPKFVTGRTLDVNQSDRYVPLESGDSRMVPFLIGRYSSYKQSVVEAPMVSGEARSL